MYRKTILSLIVLSIIWLIAIPAMTAESQGALPVGNHYFMSDRCRPCQQQSVIIKKLQKQGFSIQIYNYNKDPKIFKKLRIKGVPLIIIIKINNKGEQIILKLKGVQPLRKLLKLLVK